MNGVDNRLYSIKVPVVFDPDSIYTLKKHVEIAQNNSAVSTILLEGDNNTFCKGLSLEYISNSDIRLDLSVDMFVELLSQIYFSTKPTVALVKGQVIAGGVGLACACDFIIAGSSATITLSEGLYGLVPAIIAPFIMQRITPQKLKNLLLTCKQLSSDQALDIGLIDYLAYDEQQMQTYIQTLSKELKHVKPETVIKIKKLIMDINNEDCVTASKQGSVLLKKDLKKQQIIDNIFNYIHYGLLP